MVVEFTGAWDRSEVHDFLAAETMPVRLSFISTDEDPWMLSLWYLYEEETIRCATTEDANVMRHLRERPYCAFEVSTNEVPYRGVRGKGEVTLKPDEDMALLKRLVDRYLGDDYESFQQWLTGRDVQEYEIALKPEKIYSWDYSSRMEGLDE